MTRVEAIRVQPAEMGNGVAAMQALTLMVTYVLTLISVQFIGFLTSRLVDYQFPTLGLMTFLVLFIGAFGLAWPIAVRIAEWLIRFRGHIVETEQSGGADRHDMPHTEGADLNLNGNRLITLSPRL